MDAHKVEVNEVFIAESLEGECFWDVKAIGYKDRNAKRKCFENYLKLFGIILHSQNFTQTVFRFTFRSVFFHFGVITMAVAVAASFSLVVL